MKAGPQSTPTPTTHVVASTAPSQLRGAPSTAGLTTLAASALVPVTLAVMAGSPVSIALAALTDDAGSRYLTGAIDRVASRLRRGASQPHAPEAVQEALAGEIRALLDGDRLVARSLVPELVKILRSTGVIDSDTTTTGDGSGER